MNDAQEGHSSGTLCMVFLEVLAKCVWVYKYNAADDIDFTVFGVLAVVFSPPFQAFPFLMPLSIFLIPKTRTPIQSRPQTPVLSLPIKRKLIYQLPNNALGIAALFVFFAVPPTVP